MILKHPVRSAIADNAHGEFNDRLKAAKVLTAHWRTGTNLVDRLLGKDLYVVAEAPFTDSICFPAVSFKMSAT